MRIAVTGAKGQLGYQLCCELGRDAVPMDLPEVDVTDRETVLGILAGSHLEGIINCAAYTNVDQAEDQAELCRRVNVDAVDYLVEAARHLDCPLVHVSTDYVFGAAVTPGVPLREIDTPSPQGVYARTKLDGECRAQQWAKHCVVRTSGLYAISPGRHNFIETILRLADEQGHVRVVNDQHCTPTFVRHLARAILFLLRSGRSGIYHVVNGGATTWFDFAREIFRLSGVQATLEPITTESFGARAPRPQYSVLDTSRYRRLQGPIMPAWQDALREYFSLRDGECE